MALSRRKFIALLGGGAVVAAGAGAGGFAATSAPRSALQPWSVAASHAEPRLHALAHAILAPSAHNLQPWVAELVGADGVRIWRDRSLALPQTDPFDRQLTISMGCFLEAFDCAASATGHRVETVLLADLAEFGTLVPVAELRLMQGAPADPLFPQITRRRTSRAPFETRLPAAKLLSPLAGGHARIITDPRTVAALRGIARDAWVIEATTPAIWAESVDLMRFGRAEIDANPDGIALGGAFLESLMLVGMLNRAAQRDMTSQAFRTGLEMYAKAIDSSPAFAVITSAGNSRADQITAGRAWTRLQLEATRQGLSMQPLSQCLQEFPEMAEPFARAHELLATGVETVQMLARLGHGPAVGPAPRWPLDARMMAG